MSDMVNILSKFAVSGTFEFCEPFGSGHINDTYRATLREGDSVKRFVLQRVNNKVFTSPEALMNNFARVTSYLADKITEMGGDASREALRVIPTLSGKSFYLSDSGDCWRLMPFVENSICYDSVESPEQFYLCAVAFGKFQSLLRDFPADELYEIIPNFHNTRDRYKRLFESVEKDEFGRVRYAEAEIEFARRREGFASLFEEAREEGRLPLRVTHNDTKLNNILFDITTKRPICVVDLDTVMPGYAINDFGDSIRFGATTAKEDEADLSLVNFDIELFEIYTKGFIEGVDGGLTDAEISLLPESAIMMTFECGMRFLTDYLSGDTYFRTSRENHNLDRARNQFKLVVDMEKVLDKMHDIVDKYSQNQE